MVLNMSHWIKQIRNTIGMGLTWAIAWAIAGILLGLISALIPNQFLASVLDPWIALAMPGFIGGIIFSFMLQFIEGGHKFDTMPTGRLAGCGALAGLVLGALPFLLGTPTAQLPLWLLGVAIVGTTTLLSTASALGSAFLFRRYAG